MPDISSRRPILEATLNSDPKQIIGALFEAHADRVLRYARRRVSRSDAEEVVAETFLTAWRRAQNVPKDPLPWLIGIARNVIRNMDRAGRRRLRLELRLAATEPREAHDRESQNELTEHVVEAFESLPADDREILMLIAWDDLDHAAAAQVMGWSRANFRLRLHRARRRLARRLQEGDEPFRRSTRLNKTAPAPEEA